MAEASRSEGAISVPDADRPKVSVIIPVMNERKTISSVIRQCVRLGPDTEVIVVANGSSDGSARLAEAEGARVLHYSKPLGHDVGRSIGAFHARGQIFLFTDGDIVIPAKELRAFVSTVEAGADIALNRYSGAVNRRKVHSVVLAKHALNALLSVPQLKGMSMTAIPHAMSRQAAERIGYKNLSVPPLAQAMAISYGLSIVPGPFIEVGKSNPMRRKRRHGGADPLESLIMGDHLEALGWLLEHAGSRGNFTDAGRRRDVIR